jgi:23S rRNA (cytidine1920-2'-O)/16S rRNA (cytidine1409-2'-O)-methyltransferase
VGRHRSRYINVVQHVRNSRPDIDDPVTAIHERLLVVGGRIIENEHAMVRTDAPVVLRPKRTLRGEPKLEAALDGFGVSVVDRTCLDLGASAGGFTRVLLKRGAHRVFAVDAGHGQLRGDLRIDARVVNLERTNLADLASVLPSDAEIGLVTIDLSYLSIANAIPQLALLQFATDAEMIALVKPMFELGLPTPPAIKNALRRARVEAVRGVERDRSWRVLRTLPSPVAGARGAREWLLHAKRRR